MNEEQLIHYVKEQIHASLGRTVEQEIKLAPIEEAFKKRITQLYLPQHNIQIKCSEKDATLIITPGNLVTTIILSHCIKADKIPTDLPEQGTFEMDGYVFVYDHIEGAKVRCPTSVEYITITISQ